MLLVYVYNNHSFLLLYKFSCVDVIFSFRFLHFCPAGIALPPLICLLARGRKGTNSMRNGQCTRELPPLFQVPLSVEPVQLGHVAQRSAHPEGDQQPKNWRSAHCTDQRPKSWRSAQCTDQRPKSWRSAQCTDQRPKNWLSAQCTDQRLKNWRSAQCTDQRPKRWRSAQCTYWPATKELPTDWPATKELPTD